MKYRQIKAADGELKVSSLAIGTAVKMTGMPEKDLFGLDGSQPDVTDFYAFTTDDLIVEDYQTGPQVTGIPIAV